MEGGERCGKRANRIEGKVRMGVRWSKRSRGEEGEEVYLTAVWGRYECTRATHPLGSLLVVCKQGLHLAQPHTLA